VIGPPGGEEIQKKGFRRHVR